MKENILFFFIFLLCCVCCMLKGEEFVGEKPFYIYWILWLSAAGENVRNGQILCLNNTFFL